MSFLLSVFVLVDDFLVSNLLGSKGSLAFLNFTDSFLSEGLSVLGAGSLELFNVFETDTFNGSLLSEDFLLFALSSIGLL